MKVRLALAINRLIRKLEPDPDTGAERLVWITENDSEEVRYYSEPEVGGWRRFTTWLMGLLPIEKHL